MLVSPTHINATNIMLNTQTFYFARHGQTDANIQAVMCGGEWDIELNQTGIAQAKAAQQLLGNTEHNIRTICVSPMKRALKTAHILNEVLSVPVAVLDELREWEVGEWSKKPYHQVPNLFLGSDNPPGGETRDEFHERIRRGLVASVKNEGPVLIVSHGCVWHVITKLLNLPGGLIENVSIHRVNHDNHEVIEQRKWMSVRI